MLVPLSPLDDPEGPQKCPKALSFDLATRMNPVFDGDR